MYTTREEIEKEEQEKRDRGEDQESLWSPMLVAILLPPVGFVWGAVMLSRGEEKRGVNVMVVAVVSLLALIIIGAAL